MSVGVEALRRVGVRTTPEQLERMVMTALGEMHPVPADVRPEQELPKEGAEALRRGGFSLEPVKIHEDDDPVARAVALHSALLASSLTVAEASRLLGVNPSRVRQRLLARTLYGLHYGEQWRLPSFQFDLENGRPIPGIERVIPKLDPTLHPVALYSWFTAPETDLRVDNASVSPRDWLRMGNDPREVAAIAADL